MGLLNAIPAFGPSLFNNIMPDDQMKSMALSKQGTRGIVAGDNPMPDLTQPMPQRRGMFGTQYDQEDIMSMLLRAAAIAQGDYGAGAQFGENIGARARAAAAEAAKRQAELQDYEAKLQIAQRYETPKGPEPSPEERLFNWYSGLPADQKGEVVKTLDTLRPRMVGDPVSGYQFAPRPQAPQAIEINPEEWDSGTPVGGGSGDATGNFRSPIPRKRP